MTAGVTATMIAMSACVAQATPDRASEGVPISVRTIDANVIEGRLIEISDNALTISVDGESRQWPLDALIRIHHEAPSRIEATDATAMCFIIGGGAVRGSVRQNAPQGQVRLSIQEGRSLDIPFTALAAIRFPGPSTVAMTASFEKRRAVRRPGRDLLLLLRDGELAVAPGALESVSPAGWSFSFGGKSRSGPLAGAYGVILGSTTPPDPKARIEVAFGADSRIHATDVTADGEHLKVDAGPLGRFDIPWASIRSIDFDSRRVQGLSSLVPVTDECKSIVGGQWPARKDRNVTGGPLRIGSRYYESGWGVHADSRLEFALGGNYERFVAEFGIDASVAPRGSAVFRVLVDGEEKYVSKTLRGGDRAQRISVELNGAKRLTLLCEPADGLDLSDHGNWANAYLVRSSVAGAS